MIDDDTPCSREIDYTFINQTAQESHRSMSSRPASRVQIGVSLNPELAGPFAWVVRWHGGT
jgi:hypothetical protein